MLPAIFWSSQSQFSLKREIIYSQNQKAQNILLNVPTTTVYIFLDKVKEMFLPLSKLHCVSVFGVFRIGYGDLLCKSPYSVKMRENMD